MKTLGIFEGYWVSYDEFYIYIEFIGSSALNMCRIDTNKNIIEQARALALETKEYFSY